MENVKKQMSDAERLALADKLDKDLEEFMEKLPKREATEPIPIDELTEELKNHPFFLKELPTEDSKYHPLYEGLQQLKYDPAENTAEELATSYKEDGNFNFKYKKYRLAILSYTEGLKTGCQNKELVASLYNNRSAANYYLENYRSSLADAENSLKNKPNYDKPLMRAANCCLKMGKYNDCISYCDQISPSDPAILELRKNAVQQQKRHERDLRKKQMKTKTLQLQEQQLLKAILDRGINIDTKKDNKLKLEHVKPEALDSMVALGENGELSWPVGFMYPADKTVDFILSFPENDTFYDHLYAALDFPNKKDYYNIQSTNVYFETIADKAIKIDTAMTLKRILSMKGFTVRQGVPMFYILAAGSNEEKEFIVRRS